MTAHSQELELEKELDGTSFRRCSVVALATYRDTYLVPSNSSLRAKKVFDAALREAPAPYGEAVAR